MTLSSPMAKLTSKRKRDENLAIESPLSFCFNLPRPDTSEDGDRSPRSKMAHRFLGLALGSGGGGLLNGNGDDDEAAHSTTDTTRKRHKSDQDILDAGLTGAQDPKEQIAQPPDLRPQEHVGLQTHVAAAAASCPPGPPLSSDETGTSSPKSPPRKRVGTPPLNFKIAPNGPEEVDAGRELEADWLNGDGDVVDPVRAALTWHEDEITVYDPDDADDDGVGVNGIGFKPTPALAQSRVIRRRQQMADYRKRIEGEARSKRTQRRRAEEPLSARAKRRSPARKVHFLEPERQHAVVFTL
ncbi:hypothetical protein E4U42_002482 [Claviceps africana]|uniref:Uncharacterized protein n=1 Tax=Claviceps africana TaxID=83212 RepID=A0A8K0JCU1_9HYPO|nr:hypothetical protein E4U42_002482 [Claviceps africana]